MTPTPKAEMQDSVHLTESAGEAFTAQPMQGLAKYLHEQANKAFYEDGESTLRRWASEVEAAAAPPSDTAVSATPPDEWLKEQMRLANSPSESDQAFRAGHSADTAGSSQMKTNLSPDCPHPTWREAE